MLLYPGLMITTENSHVKKYQLEIGEFLGWRQDTWKRNILRYCWEDHQVAWLTVIQSAAPRFSVLHFAVHRIMYAYLIFNSSALTLIWLLQVGAICMQVTWWRYWPGSTGNNSLYFVSLVTETACGIQNSKFWNTYIAERLTTECFS